MERDRNRTVHAEDMYVEIVRYDRAGKWYEEPKSGNVKRRPRTLSQAVDRAMQTRYCKGKINLGLPGGQAFDAQVRARLLQDARTT